MMPGTAVLVLLLSTIAAHNTQQMQLQRMVSGGRKVAPV